MHLIIILMFSVIIASERGREASEIMTNYDQEHLQQSVNHNEDEKDG